MQGNKGYRAPSDDDDDRSGAATGFWVLLALLLLLLLGAIVILAIALARVSFSIDSTNCGGSTNQCIQPYKDYLGNCVDGRFKPNGRSCNDTCGAGSGTCVTGECITQCNGLCPTGNSTECPHLIVYSPLFGEYTANRTCELGGVCTYHLIHDSFIAPTDASISYVWNDGNMVMLKNKCADILSNSTFTPKTCLTVDVYFVPIGQPLTGNQNSTLPTLTSLIRYIPQCFYTFECAQHSYDAGSLSDSLPASLNQDGTKQLLTWKEACIRAHEGDASSCA